MAIDILSIKPSVISKDLRGKFLCIYGAEKVGKSTFGSQLPNALFCNFEVGTNFLPGVRAQNIEKWTDFKLVLRQLAKPEAHDLYQTVVIDTVGQAYTLCEQFICAQYGIQKLGDAPYGQAYDACKKEFENCLRKITMNGYGILCIAHAQVKNVIVREKNEKGKEEEIVYEKYSPAMPARAAEIVNRLVDIIAYINIEYDKDGNSTRTLITRGTPYVMAGSRLKYLEPKIPFGYQELIDAIARAVDKQQELDGAQVVEHAEVAKNEEIPYEVGRERLRELWDKLVKPSSDEPDEEMANRILKKVEMIFGRPMRLSEITEDQNDLLQLCLIEIEDLARQTNK